MPATAQKAPPKPVTPDPELARMAAIDSSRLARFRKLETQISQVQALTSAVFHYHDTDLETAGWLLWLLSREVLRLKCTYSGERFEWED